MPASETVLALPSPLQNAFPCITYSGSKALNAGDPLVPVNEEVSEDEGIWSLKMIL